MRIHRPIALTLVLLIALAGPLGCGDDTTGGDPDADVTADGQPPSDTGPQPDGYVSPGVAQLELYLLDIWGQLLPADEVTLTVTKDGDPVTLPGFPANVLLIPLNDAAEYQITLEVPDHETQQVRVDFNGSDEPSATTVTHLSSNVNHGLAVSRDQRTLAGDLVWVHTVYFGLRHQWFSAQGPPARRGNDISLLISGEEAWGAVHTELSTAQDEVMVATWWWDSEFELVRDPATHHLLTPTERWDNTMLGMLEASPALHRVLIGEFWGSNNILDWLTTDSDMQAYAENGGDDFEILGQGNPTSGLFQFKVDSFTFSDRVLATHTETVDRAFEADAPVESTVPSRPVDLTWWPVSVEVQIASYHQKFLVVDQDVAFVGGMNIKGVDWDTEDHEVYNHRRMPFDASQAAREDVMNKDALPEFGPRKDYMMRIEGPAVQDVADLFQRRWSYQISEGVANSQYASDFAVLRDQPAQPGGSQVQITATLPEPFWEHAIAETWFNAVEQAEEYIFIEDQYWRIPMLTSAIIDRMNQVPGLRLLVVTKPVSEWTDPGCWWTHQTHQELMAAFPNRYATYMLRAFDTVVTWGWDETEERYQDMDVHSKILIVDDRFLSVGSCNKNNRGIVYEGELNVAVLNPTWVRQERRRIFANMLGPSYAATDDVATWWTHFSDAASWNDYVWQNWDDEGGDIDLGTIGNLDPLPLDYTPDGFVHSLGFRSPSDCLIENVGPDMT